MFTDGYFYEWFTTADGKTSFSFDWADGSYDMSAFLSPEKLEFYRKRVSPLKFRSEYLGLFIEDASFVFQNILALVMEKSLAGQPVYGGLDFGTGKGEDSTVLTLLDANGNMHSVYAWSDLAPTAQIDKICQILNTYPSIKFVNCETNSIGSVYLDMLKNKVKKKSIIKEFTTTNDSKRRIIENLATAFENFNIHILHDPELIRQLQHYSIEKTKSGKVTYNGIGAHDDYVMSLAFAYDFFNNKVGKYNISFAK